ncbi:glycoside hydrolase family 32 protein [Ligilactobacillus animalis]|uniref:glycoside hydrolase family 32 protein n=1 Tax=Ligilactobacillus animalis TaxID=1605 RepID=UPI0010A2B77A|nr:glycoside hydrolase family 32 protein [Ligilactobacillus animalis]MDO5882930.1 glycoside hydrolase family 32 protein [Ligilactobacillus animalis]THE19997.1 sucrose-6-phosphate hydrolase [Ligilactobacillus animalis]THE22177.1 sucrose-6-phosphate hydrolase [Ligilactobacillus animalis]
MKQMIKLNNDRYRLGYHVSAPAGWINDPNGFCYYKGYYHIFYQYHPYSADWGPMHWGHARSKDLVHWESLPIALAPDTKADEDGCFSGSAIVKDDVLYLIYTGHHYYDDGDPDHFWQNQNLAYSTDGINFTKYENNPIIASAPEDNTHHFRDPKVWEKDGKYYMILGSQGKDGVGRAIIYRSDDLKDWQYLGEIAKANGLTTEGFMWECPDFFELAGKDILLLSPQGIEAQGQKYLNLFQTGYFVGNFDYSTNTFEHGGFTELDHGHDFYATQTTLAPDGRRLVFGWMDMWESRFPEKADGWAGALTLLRELELKDDQLYMRPVKEAVQLRTAEISAWNKQVTEKTLLCENEHQAEIDLTLTTDQAFELAFTDQDKQVKLTFDQATHTFTLLNGDARYASIKPNSELKLQIFIDTSSLEIFINDGEAVFTERFYFDNAPQVWLTAKAQCLTQVYRLDGQAITFE